MQHKLSNHNEEDRTATCSICGPTKMKLRDKTRPLAGRYRCRTIWKINYNNTVYPYIRHKGTKCQQCGFIPAHISQLDVDHIDGDRFNNDLANLQTLCANCHRLKTHLSGDSNSGIF